MKPGGVAVTTAGELKPFKVVIHAVGPQDQDTEGNRNMLVNTIVLSMIEASLRGLQSISIPGISCGIYDFPKPTSAKCHIESFIIFSSQTQFYPSMKFVCISLFNIDECEIFKNEFIRQSDSFDCIEYYGLPSERGLSYNHSLCGLCHKSLPLQAFSIVGCCRNCCNYCIYDYSYTNCPTCNNPLNIQTDYIYNFSLCSNCNQFYQKNSVHQCA